MAAEPSFAARAQQCGRVEIVSAETARSLPGHHGLLVPGPGPTASREATIASLVRGRVEHSSLGGLPGGPPLIELDGAGGGGSLPKIYVSVPPPGKHPNDRRYPVVIAGTDMFEPGMLVSETTRIPGVVTTIDVTLTALCSDGGLTTEPMTAREQAQQLAALDERIRKKNSARLPASLGMAAALALLALARPRAGVAGFAAAMAANLALGVAEASEPWLLASVIGASTLFGGLLLARLPNLQLGLVLSVVVAAYLVAMAADATTVALSPLGPTQTGRFYGFNNLLATLALPVVLTSCVLLTARIGLRALVAVGAVALVTIGGNRFGADGGGAIVLAVALTVLALRLRDGLSRRSLVVGLAGGVAAALVLIAVDVATGGSSHVTEAVREGPASLAGDFADRIEISVRRTVESAGAIAIVALGLGLMAWFGLRERRFATSDAMLVAILVSLVVNDTPSDVAGFGALGLAALWRWERARAEGAGI